MENTTKQTIFERVLRACLSAFLFLLPWQTVYIYKDQFLNGVKWEYGTLDFYATEVLLWVCAGLFMVWYWRQVKNQELGIRNVRLTSDRAFVVSVLLFVLYCFITAHWSLDRRVAEQHALRILEAALLFFMLYLGPLPRRLVAWSFATGAVLPSVLGIWQFLSQSTIDSSVLGLTKHVVSDVGSSVVVSDTVGRWLRAYGTFPHPNMFGGYLVIAIATGLSLLFRQDNRWQRILLLSVILIETAALFFTFSRSAWISFVMVLLFHCCIGSFYKQKQLIVPIASVLACLGMLTILFFPLVHVRTEAASVNEKQSIDERVSGYQEAIQLWKSRPWSGVGVGTYTMAAWHHDKWHPGWVFQPVHNVPLLMLAELGILGIVLTGAVVVSFFIYHVTRNTKQMTNRSIVTCFMLYGTCLVPLAGLDHYLFSSYTGLLLTIVYIVTVGQFIHCLSTIHPPSLSNGLS